MGRNKKFDIQPFSEFIDSVVKEYAETYRFDYYIPIYKPVEGINLSQMEKYVDSTIQVYQRHHPDFSLPDAARSCILELFQEPKAINKFVSFDQTLILPELYKILGHIDSTRQCLKFIADPSQYPKNYLAKIQSDMKEIESLRNHHRKNIIGITRLADPTESRLRYWLATLYYKNRTLTNFFLHVMLLADLEKLAILEKDAKNKAHIENILEFFLIQHTEPSAVMKSLGILLYYEIFAFLKLSHRKAGEYTQNIIYEIFEADINMNEFQRHIFIKSSVGWWPIFGAAKKSPSLEDDRSFIRKTLSKELRESIIFDEKIFDEIFRHMIKKPHIQFLQKYPGEFFRINPKYSP